jgi:hypothetical protein
MVFVLAALLALSAALNIALLVFIRQERTIRRHNERNGKGD